MSIFCDTLGSCTEVGQSNKEKEEKLYKHDSLGQFVLCFLQITVIDSAE